MSFLAGENCDEIKEVIVLHVYVHLSFEILANRISGNDMFQFSCCLSVCSPCTEQTGVLLEAISLRAGQCHGGR